MVVCDFNHCHSRSAFGCKKFRSCNLTAIWWPKVRLICHSIPGQQCSTKSVNETNCTTSTYKFALLVQFYHVACKMFWLYNLVLLVYTTSEVLSCNLRPVLTFKGYCHSFNFKLHHPCAVNCLGTALVVVNNISCVYRQVPITDFSLRHWLL